MRTLLGLVNSVLILVRCPHLRGFDYNSVCSVQYPSDEKQGGSNSLQNMVLMWRLHHYTHAIANTKHLNL